MSKILYLPVEVLERELDSRLLLALEAANRGYVVYIGYYLNMPRIAFQLGSGFYFYKAMTDYNAKKLFAPLKAAGVYCGSLDEEGLIYRSMEYYDKMRIGSGDSLEVLDIIFTNGEAQKTWINTKYRATQHKVTATGNPRFDLLRSPYSDMYAQDAQYIKRKWGSYVLINTNFGPANFSPIFGRSWLEHLQWAGIAETTKEISEYQEIVDYYEELINYYVDAIIRLSEAIYPSKIILRPHPAEDDRTWHDRLSKLPNVHVLFSGTSKPWIKAAECVIHTGCTTGVEAFSMGVPVIRYNPLHRDDLEPPQPNIVSCNCVSYDCLLKQVNLALSGSCSSDADDGAGKRDYLRAWIRNIDGAFAFNKIMDEIDSICIGKGVRTRKYKLSLREKLLLSRSQIKNSLKGVALSIEPLGRLRMIQAYMLQRKRFPGIKKAELNKKIKAFGIVDSRLRREYSVESADIDVFRISV